MARLVYIDNPLFRIRPESSETQIEGASASYLQFDLCSFYTMIKPSLIKLIKMKLFGDNIYIRTNARGGPV
jgi:hypothetical protein